MPIYQIFTITFIRFNFLMIFVSPEYLKKEEFSIMSKKRIVAFGMVLLAALLVLPALGFANGGSPSPTPQGFDKYLVYTAAGLYDPGVPPAEGDLADWFHKDVMGRSVAEIASEKAAADAFFLARFGPGLTSMPFGVDPRSEYRAYVISGEWVASEGWVVRDGGFMVMVPDDGSGGKTLYGTWGGPTGTWVPAGSMIVFGDYNIKREGPGNSAGSTTQPLIIHYQSADPIIQHPFEDGIKFNCTVISEDFGEGLAQGLSRPETVGGKLQANIRNILTFPGLGPSIEH